MHVKPAKLVFGALLTSSLALIAIPSHAARNDASSPQAIEASDSHNIVVAGGTENMSRAPYLLKDARFGYRLGQGELTDSLLSEGLSCAMCEVHMGNTAENIAKRYTVSREAQDQFAALSQRRASEAIAAGKFKREIVPVPIRGKKGRGVASPCVSHSLPSRSESS